MKPNLLWWFSLIFLYRLQQCINPHSSVFAGSSGSVFLCRIIVFSPLRKAMTSNVKHDVQNPQDANQLHTNADKKAALSGLVLIRSGSWGEGNKDREHLSQETSHGTDSVLKGDDGGGITTSCCALEPPFIKDNEVSNVVRMRERTSTLWIIGIQIPSQVSEAEGELGERVASVWIHYELVHADAPCNHLRQMERRTERGPSNRAGLSGKMYGCPHPPGTHSQHLFRSFSLQQSLSLWISFFLSVSIPLSPSPHFSRLLPRRSCFPEPHLAGGRWCANVPFHPIKWRALKGPASVCAHSRVTNPPNHQPQHTATCALRYLKRLHSSVGIIPQHTQPRCYFWITTDVWIIPPLKRTINAIISYRWQ